MVLGLVFNVMYNKHMNFLKKNWYKFVSMVYMFSIPIISFAQNTPTQPIAGTTPSNPATSTCSAGRICNPIPNITSIPGLIQTILTGLITIGIPIIALAIVYSGFLFVFARGNSKKLTKAKESLLWTIVGAAVLLGAWAIAKMISATVTGLSA